MYDNVLGVWWMAAMVLVYSCSVGGADGRRHEVLRYLAEEVSESDEDVEDSNKFKGEKKDDDHSGDTGQYKIDDNYYDEEDEDVLTGLGTPQDHSKPKEVTKTQSKPSIRPGSVAKAVDLTKCEKFNRTHLLRLLKRNNINDYDKCIENLRYPIQFKLFISSLSLGISLIMFLANHCWRKMTISQIDDLTH